MNRRRGGVALYHAAPMRYLVVHAHPSPASFGHAVYETAVRALTEAGHEVTAIDLYGERFVAAMSAAERAAYETGAPVVDDHVARHAELVRQAEGLVMDFSAWENSVLGRHRDAGGALMDNDGIRREVEWLEILSRDALEDPWQLQRPRTVFPIRR